MALVKGLGVLVAGIVVTGCGIGHIIEDGVQSGPAVRASGKLKSEDRKVGAFDKIEVSGVATLDVKIGPAGPLRVTGDDNVLSHVITKVEGGTLKIYIEGHINGISKLEMKVSTPDLVAVNGSGATHVDVAGIKAKDFDAIASGASEIKLAGSAKKLSLDISGASHLFFAGVAADEINGELNGASGVEISGTAGTIDVEANGASSFSGQGLTVRSGRVTANGASSVKLGKGSSVTKEVSGASSVSL